MMHFILILCILVPIGRVGTIQANTDSVFCSIGDHSIDSSCSNSQLYHNYLYGDSKIEEFPGHYPSKRCRMTNVYLDGHRRAFHVGVNNLSQLDICFGTRQIWDFSTKAAAAINFTTSDLDQGFVCNQVFKTGHVFSTYYHHGSNYFHLHYDTALPLYNLIHHEKPENKNSGNGNNVVFMPSVELQRGMGTDWNSIAFLDESMYWNKMIQVLTYPNKVLPLDMRLLAMKKTLCFDEIYFGMPKFDASDPKFVFGFSSFVKSQFSVTHLSRTSLKHCHKCIGLIQRVGRRKILNEKDLISALDQVADVQLIDFSNLSLEKQIEEVQKYDILVGINGAGLVNALYLPNNSVAIQLVPYNAQLNHEEYSVLLKARGPYLDWHNLHSELTLPTQGDPFNNNPDTVVHVQEFVNLIKEALKLQMSTLI